MRKKWYVQGSLVHCGIVSLCCLAAWGSEVALCPYLRIWKSLMTANLNTRTENRSSLAELNHQTERWISFSRVVVLVSSVCVMWNICSGIHNLRSRLDCCHWSAKTPKLNLYPSSHLSANRHNRSPNLNVKPLSKKLRPERSSDVPSTSFDSFHKQKLKTKLRLKRLFLTTIYYTLCILLTY